jgi:hypothetical protein
MILAYSLILHVFIYSNKEFDLGQYAEQKNCEIARDAVISTRRFINYYKSVECRMVEYKDK